MNMNTQTPEYPSSLPPLPDSAPVSGNDRAPTSCGSSMGDLGEGRHDLEGFGESLIWDTIFGGNGFMMVSSCFMMFNDVFDDVPSIWPFFCINIMDTRMTDLLAHYEPMVV